MKVGEFLVEGTVELEANADVLVEKEEAIGLLVLVESPWLIIFV